MDLIGIIFLHREGNIPFLTKQYPGILSVVSVPYSSTAIPAVIPQLPTVINIVDEWERRINNVIFSF